MEEIFVFDKSLTTEIEAKIREMANKHQIPMSRVIVDEDGVGGGIVDHLHCKGFVNNSRALADGNFQNLKSQCFYKLAERVNSAGIYCGIDTYKNEITQELEAMRRKDVDKEGKLGVIAKEKVKEIIGRSPDFADAIMMREYFALEKKGIVSIGWSG